jgi:AbiV family abortive infection protein
LKNGKRLLQDAELLLYPESAPTAYVLSVLAQEEFAKAFLLHLVEDDCIPWSNDVRMVLNDHKCKQLAGLILDYLNPDDDVFLERVNSENIGKRSLWPPPHVVDAINIIRHERVSKMARIDWHDPADKPLAQGAKKIADGDFDTLKQDALYVRIGRTGKVVSEPTKINLHLARTEFQKAKRFDEGYRLKGLDYEIVTSLFKVMFGLISAEEFNSNWWIER